MRRRKLRHKITSKVETSVKINFLKIFLNSSSMHLTNFAFVVCTQFQFVQQAAIEEN